MRREASEPARADGGSPPRTPGFREMFGHHTSDPDLRGGAGLGFGLGERGRDVMELARFSRFDDPDDHAWLTLRVVFPSTQSPRTIVVFGRAGTPCSLW